MISVATIMRPVGQVVSMMKERRLFFDKSLGSPFRPFFPLPDHGLGA